MKYLKILPAAASIIALTATTTFARDQKDAEDGDYFKIKVETRVMANNAKEISAGFSPGAHARRPRYIYRVEIDRGYRTIVVSVDAYTGRILGRGARSMTV